MLRRLVRRYDAWTARIFSRVRAGYKAWDDYGIESGAKRAYFDWMTPGVAVGLLVMLALQAWVLALMLGAMLAICIIALRNVPDSRMRALYLRGRARLRRAKRRKAG